MHQDLETKGAIREFLPFAMSTAPSVDILLLLTSSSSKTLLLFKASPSADAPSNPNPFHDIFMVFKKIFDYMKNTAFEKLIVKN